MFNNRSNQKELLDVEQIPEADLFQNLKELHVINSLLGGYQVSLNALKKIEFYNQPLTLVDIGSGGGDTLKTIFNWSKKYNKEIKLYGIDLKRTCVDYSNQNEPNESLNFICDDYRNIHLHVNEVNIIHASLFCHHLSTIQIIELIKFAIKHKAILIINDLERNRFAYYSIKFLTKLFSKSYLVKNDAPLSVLRGFKKTEWLDMIQQAGAKKYMVKNKWAFRHEVIVYG
jgi:2-polyprenyl-3-methyl-5-hydroxy-6-metoxy-1,4-benzoquinol methylase